MAPLAVEFPDSRWRDTFARATRLLAWAPGRLEFAARLAAICAITALVTEIYKTPDPALTIYVAFFMLHPDRTSSIILALAFTVIITVVIGLTFILANLTLDAASWRVLAMAVVSFAFLFLTSASKLEPIGATIAFLVAYPLDLLGSVPTGEVATRGLLYAWLFIGIPAGVSIVYNLLLGPSPRWLLQRNLALRLDIAASTLQVPDDAHRAALAGALRGGNEKFLSLLRMAKLERTSPAEDLSALEQATHASFALLLALDYALGMPGAALAPGQRTRLAATLTDMARVLPRGGYPRNVAIEEAAGGAPLSTPAWREIEDALARFAEHSDPPEPPAPKTGGGFLRPDAFSNTLHVHYALKTTGAAMFCYILFSILDWPGIHTSFLTCYIVSLGTTADTVEKLTLRITGCLVGAAAGLLTLIFIVPNFDSITALLVIVFAASLASGWVAAGGPHIAYAGFQIAFAFFLCVIQGAAPSFDMATARDRIVGILLGNFVIYVTYSHIWPVSVKSRIEKTIKSLLKMLSELASASRIRERRMLAAETQAHLKALEEDLHVAFYEPSSVRPSRTWLARRGAIARAVGDLAPALFLQAGQENAAAAARSLAALSQGQALVEPRGDEPVGPLLQKLKTAVAEAARVPS